MRLSLLLLAGLCAAGGCATMETPEARIARFNDLLVERHAASIVPVHYYFKNDAQGRPADFPVSFFCPQCGNLHYAMAQQLIAEQRPFVAPGYVVAPDRVITSNIRLRPEWLDRIEIVAPEGTVTAAIDAVYPEQRSVLLKSAAPLPGAEPFAFVEETPGEALFDFHLIDETHDRVSGVAPHNDGRVAELLATGYRTLDFTPVNVVVVNAEGDPVRLSMSYETPFNQRAIRPPAEWQARSVAEEEAALERVLAEVRQAVYPVKLSFAAPENPLPSPYGRGREVNVVETVGVLLASGELLVLQQLAPDMTARLEKIEIHTGAATVPATFIESKRDFSVFTARPQSELPGGLTVYSGDIRALYSQEAIGVVLRSYGEEQSLRARFVPVENLANSFRDNLVIQSPSANDCNLYFTESGQLLAVMSFFRQDGGMRGAGVIPAGALVQGAADDRNVPQPPERRRQMAWFGVTVQPLEADLAQALGLAADTVNGAMGLLVTRVYPDSTAEALGIKTGDVLMGVSSADSDMLMPLSGSYFSGAESGTPLWERYDEIPPEYFDQMPQPWPAISNPLNQLLLGIGLGSEARIVWIADGEPARARFEVMAAPASFDTAPRYQAAALGLTAADLTFEVRDYFRMAEDEPGVIVARVRPGSKAAVAGLKPYELILKVNDVPVHNTEEFRKLLAADGEIRIEVRRLGQNRIVTLNP